jgi:hypothetical protein
MDSASLPDETQLRQPKGWQEIARCLENGKSARCEILLGEVSLARVLLGLRYRPENAHLQRKNVRDAWEIYRTVEYFLPRLGLRQDQYAAVEVKLLELREQLALAGQETSQAVLPPESPEGPLGGRMGGAE